MDEDNDSEKTEGVGRTRGSVDPPFPHRAVEFSADRPRECCRTLRRTSLKNVDK